MWTSTDNNGKGYAARFENGVLVSFGYTISSVPFEITFSYGDTAVELPETVELPDSE